jgi:hypothetical protein
MGQITELPIRAWQKTAGIEPGPGLWRELQNAAFETIRIAELELSGIRDGDGHWHGSDVVARVLNNLQNIISGLRKSYGLDQNGGTA